MQCIKGRIWGEFGMKKVCVAVLIVSMVLIAMGGLCGQRFLEDETPPIESRVVIENVHGIDVFRRIDG